MDLELAAQPLRGLPDLVSEVIELRLVQRKGRLFAVPIPSLVTHLASWASNAALTRQQTARAWNKRLNPPGYPRVRAVGYNPQLNGPRLLIHSSVCTAPKTQ